MNRISVIIPAYDAAETLGRCLDAIARQTRVPDEVLVVDDGSHDTSAAIAEQRGVRVLRVPHGGASAARNAGARQAGGDLLFFCDADVVLEPQALAKLESLLVAHAQAAFAYSAFRQWQGQVMGGQPFDAEALKRHNYISTMALVRRDVFPGFDTSLLRFQDWDVWLTIAARGGIGVGTPEVFFRVLVPGRISRGALSRLRATRQIRKKHGLAMRTEDFFLTFKEVLTSLIWNRTSRSSS